MSNGDNSVAPSCPISHSQDPSNPRGTAPTRLPAIPIATDLPSLIRAVNVMRDILRNITTSLTINNTYMPRSPKQPKIYGDRNYTVSPYPDWKQVEYDNESGYVGKDPKQRAYVERLHTIIFRNNERDDDNLFKWHYKLPLTGRGEGNEPFEEDFFERVIKVHWKKAKPSVFYTLDWMWGVEFPGSNTPITVFFCTPWEGIPGDASNLLASPDEFASWTAVMFPHHDPAGITVSGAPTVTGNGMSASHGAAQLAGSGGTVVGTSMTVNVKALQLYPAKCWGSNPYPPPPLMGYWSAFCKLYKLNSYTVVGAYNVNAGGITASKNGKPLKKVQTTMFASSNAISVHVTFEDEDPD